jgi:hypothetical protein
MTSFFQAYVARPYYHVVLFFARRTDRNYRAELRLHNLHIVDLEAELNQAYRHRDQLVAALRETDREALNAQRGLL